MKAIIPACLLGLASMPAAAQDSAPPPKRAAILVGVKEYRPDNYAWTPGSPVMLKDLVTPCDGVEAISAKLQQLGWTYDDQDDQASEIKEFCDGHPALVEAYIKEKVAAFDRPEDLLVIYLAAHGAEVGKRNYIFGPKAKLNLQYEADRLHAHNDNLLFVGQAFDLESAVFRPAGVLYRGNVLVILDTCRDDPVSFNELSQALGRPIGGPQVDQRARGVVIYYATAPGKRVRDGRGLSNMARRFSETLQPGKRVDQITSAVTSKIMNDTAATDNMETPIPSGQFNNTDLCFAGCQSADLHRRKPIKLAQTMVRRDTTQSDFAIPLVLAQSRNPRFEYSKALSVAPARGTMDVEIFWCPVEGKANEEKARALANQLRDRPWTAVNGRMVMPGMVRFRELTKEENDRPTLQLSDDAIRVDFDSEDEAKFAEHVSTAAASNLRIEQSRLRSVDAVAVYLCAGATPAKPPSRLIVQAAHDDQRAMASIVSEIVGEASPGLVVTDVDSRPEVQENSPESTQIRYFHERDSNRAQEVASLITRATGQEVDIKFLPEYASTARDGDIELWLGSKVKPTEALVSLSRFVAEKDCSEQC